MVIAVVTGHLSSSESKGLGCRPYRPGPLRRAEVCPNLRDEEAARAAADAVVADDDAAEPVDDATVTRTTFACA